MKTRSYNQLCGLAFALDVVGERWTLLVIRELFAGPRRFTDLMDGLPGISTNLLSERLKSLEYTGLLHRRILPPPAASMVYELTSLGRALEPALLELGKWGSQLIPSTPEGATILHLGSYALTPKTFFRPHLATDLDETYALYVGEETQQIHIAHGKLTVQQGEPAQADVALYTEPAIYLGLLQGELLIEEAIAAGLARVKGDKAALQRFLTICRIGPPTDGKPHTCVQ